MNGGNQQKPIAVNVNTLDQFTCECGGKFFGKVYEIRKASAMVSPTGQAMFIFVETAACISCGKAYQTDEVLKLMSMVKS